MYFPNGQPESASTDELLKRDDCSLAELFESADFLAECRSHNPRLIEFLSTSPTAEKLVDYAVFYRTGGKTAGGRDHCDQLVDGSASLHPARHSQSPSQQSASDTQVREFADLDQQVWQEQQDARYGAIATEVFLSDIPPLYEAIFASSHLFEKFLNGFLRQPPGTIELAPAANWSKILSTLLLKRTVDAITFLKSQSARFIEHLVAHGLRNPAIMQILLKLVGVEELVEARGQGVLEWLVGCNLISILVAKLDCRYDPEEHFAAASAALDIIAICQSFAAESVVQGRSLLVDQLKSHETAGKILDYMLACPKSNYKSSFTNGIAICIELIRRSCSPDPLSIPDEPASGEGVASESGVPEAPSVQTNIGRQILALDAHELVLLLSERLGSFRTILETPQSSEKDFRTTMGLLRPLGIQRLRVLELLCELVRYARMEVEHDTSTRRRSAPASNDEQTEGGQEAVEREDPNRVPDMAKSPAWRARTLLVQRLITSKILVTCVELFFAFPWNNLLHGIVYDMIFRILNGPLPINVDLALTVLKDADLLKRIVHAHRSNDYSSCQPRGPRLGYMGHITLVADEVVKFTDQDETVRHHLLPALESEEWLEYVCRTLPLLLERDRRPLGGERPAALRGAHFDPPGARSDPFLACLHEGEDDYAVHEPSRDYNSIKTAAAQNVEGLPGEGHVAASGAHQGGGRVSAAGQGTSAAYGRYANEQFVRYLCHQMASDVPGAFGEDLPDRAEDDEGELDHNDSLAWWGSGRDEGLRSADLDSLMREKRISPDLIQRLSLEIDEEESRHTGPSDTDHDAADSAGPESAAPVSRPRIRDREPEDHSPAQIPRRGASAGKVSKPAARHDQAHGRQQTSNLASRRPKGSGERGAATASNSRGKGGLAAAER